MRFTNDSKFIRRFNRALSFLNAIWLSRLDEYGGGEIKFYLKIGEK